MVLVYWFVLLGLFVAQVWLLFGLIAAQFLVVAQYLLDCCYCFGLFGLFLARFFGSSSVFIVVVGIVVLLCCSI